MMSKQSAIISYLCLGFDVGDANCNVIIAVFVVIGLIILLLLIVHAKSKLTDKASVSREDVTTFPQIPVTRAIREVHNIIGGSIVSQRDAGMRMCDCRCGRL